MSLKEAYLREFGYEILEKRFVADNKNRLNIDQCFKTHNKIYFVYLIEQKVRDDHDSSKKRGQISNFEKKLGEMVNRYEENNLVGIVYFIDPELRKNKTYYQDELAKMTNAYGVELHLSYGEELFQLLNHTAAWNQILKYLKKWKTEIPDFPETNFDLDAESSFEEIKDLSPRIYRQIFEDDAIFEEIILTLFPEKKTLRLLLHHFQSKASAQVIYGTIANLLQSKL